ncbi:hypothetical protein [Deinococcus cellulosilyticus]|uniref:hypothetical protein n=1 Tax=Deinococcus cellulosilyticus TaxID=401558 RepID=UPI0011BD6754|nr:hypothetical protein [Deinococcus cellulosilyticus]
MAVAQKRVLLYTPHFADVKLADAFRLIVLDKTRQVRVYTVTVPFFSFKPDTTVNALTLLGVATFEAQVNSKESVLVIDDYVFTSKSLGKVPYPKDIKLVPANEADAYLKWFKTTVDKAHLIKISDIPRRIRSAKP